MDEQYKAQANGATVERVRSSIELVNGEIAGNACNLLAGTDGPSDTAPQLAVPGGG